jgi:hypothetical protein
MASWMVHLRIADKLLDRLEGLDETLFIVGNIAPDSGVPNEDWSSFTPSGDVSHFKAKGTDKSKIDIDRYVNEYFTKDMIKNYSAKEFSFFLGYLTKEMSDKFVEDAVETIMMRIKPMIEGEMKLA